jgi:hypothetical protein
VRCGDGRTHFQSDNKRRERADKPCARAATWFMLLFRDLLRPSVIHIDTACAHLDTILQKSFRKHITAQQTQLYPQRQRQKETLMTFKITKRQPECARMSVVATAARKNYPTAIPKKKSPLSPSETAADCPSSPPQQPLWTCTSFDQRDLAL